MWDGDAKMIDSKGKNLQQKRKDEKDFPFVFFVSFVVNQFWCS